MKNDTQTTLAITKTGLHECGYKGGLLRENYSYDGSHVMPLAAFAYPTYDIRTACISVIDVVRDTMIENRVRDFMYFGAPVLFACGQDTIQWWVIERDKVCPKEEIRKNKIEAFFKRNKSVFSPDRIYRAKNFGRLDKNQQLTFVDDGLMPLLEQDMGKRVSGLMERVISILHRECFTSEQLKKSENQRWIFQASFWLLCAKILHNKDVEKFRRLDFNDVDSLIDRVNRHYQSEKDLQITTERQWKALKKAAIEFEKFSSLANITTESLSYVYENVLVDKGLRKALGIHATPSYLVDYIVWQLCPWIEKIPQENRVVLEPTCGHAPFLASAMRLLRFLYDTSESNFHHYATIHLRGIEKDPFAREIARLSLTLADVPNPNGWKIDEKDAYEDNVLSDCAKRATILLCNPPFENFKAEKEKYSNLRTTNKASEVLANTLDYMSEGSVFGIILPQGFLHKKNLFWLREKILKEWEISQICTLPENVFRFARHKSAVLFGRKKRKAPKISFGDNQILFRQVSAKELDAFRQRYEGQDRNVRQSRFTDGAAFDFRVIDLEEVWEYCKLNFRMLKDTATVGRGIEYKNVKKSVRDKYFEGAVQGFAKFQKTVLDRRGKRKKKDLLITETPDLFWMDLSEKSINNPRYGKNTGTAQLLLNYARISATPWRLETLIDSQGHPFTNRILGIKSDKDKFDFELVWAILNSPLANAFVYSYSMERDNLEETVRRIPVPVFQDDDTTAIRSLVQQYFSLYKDYDGFFVKPMDKANAKELLLKIDAKVLKLYNLPPKYEKAILDKFQGIQRKGVDFEFKGYYPKDFESCIPLHEYISEEYQHSTAAFADEWVKKQHSERITKILKNATEAFDEDEGDA